MRKTDKIIIYDNRDNPPCGHVVLECDGDKCTPNLEWVINKAIYDLFDVQLTVGGSDTMVRLVSVGIILALIVIIIIVSFLVWKYFHRNATIAEQVY